MLHATLTNQMGAYNGMQQGEIDWQKPLWALKLTLCVMRWGFSHHVSEMDKKFLQGISQQSGFQWTNFCEK